MKISLTHPDFREHAGKVLKSAREVAGATGVEVARFAGISGGFLSEIESGKRFAKYDTLAKICEYLKMSPEQVYDAALATAEAERAGRAGHARVLNEDAPPFGGSRQAKTDDHIEDLARWLLLNHIGKEDSYKLAVSLANKAASDGQASRRARKILELLED